MSQVGIRYASPRFRRPYSSLIFITRGCYSHMATLIAILAIEGWTLNYCAGADSEHRLSAALMEHAHDTPLT